MRKSLLLGVVTVVPIAGFALFGARASGADQPANPTKDVVPKEVAPKDVAPKDVAPKDVPPKDVAPKDATPKPPITKDPRQVPKRDSAKDPRDSAKDPRDTARDPALNARDPRATTRDTRRESRRTDRDLGLTFGRVAARGLAVSDLTTSSPLYKSGLRTEDYIVSVNGHRLERTDDFDRWVNEGESNDRIKVIVWRDGREEIVYFEPTVFYVDDSYNDDFVYFGVVFDDRYPDRLIVRSVHPESPAFVAGLREGDVITTWHGERIASPRDFGSVLHRIDGGTVDFEYARDSKPMRAEARFNHRVAARTSADDAAPAREARAPARDLHPSPNAPAPTVTPNPPTVPAPVPAPTVTPPPAPRPALIRGR